MELLQTGNAFEDGKETRGWIVGHFAKEGLAKTDELEVKWANHKKGESRSGWVTGETRTSIIFLVSGRVEMEFRDRTILLHSPGDYVMWGEGTDHRWNVQEDSVAVTIRWPSTQ